MAEYIDLDTPLEVYVDRGGFYRQQTTTLRELLDTNKIPYTAAYVVERKTGRWIEDSGNIACSICHTIWLHRRTSYCPNCGAQMESEEK